MSKKNAWGIWRIYNEEETIVIYSKNGELIRCLPDHEFVTENGIIKKAQELSIGDKILL